MGSGLQYCNFEPETDDTVRPNNPLATSRTMTLADGNLVSAQTSAYDRHFNQTDSYEYAYGVGAAGALLRHSHTDFLTVNPANGVNYADPAGGSIYALSDPHIRNLPAQSWVSADLYGTAKQTLT